MCNTLVLKYWKTERKEHLVKHYYFDELGGVHIKTVDQQAQTRSNPTSTPTARK